MVKNLQPEVEVISQFIGTPFYANSIFAAQKLAHAYNRQTGRFTAPMPFLLQKFLNSSQWYTANSEDLSGILKYDISYLDSDLKKGTAYVATAHGGRDGKVGIILTPDKIELALQLWKDTEKDENRKGLNSVYAAVLDDIYEGKDVMSVLLNDGYAPDGRKIGVYSFQQMIAGETPKDFSPYVIVRTLALAQKTVSDYDSIDRLTNIVELQEQGLSIEQIAKQETVTDSQVIVYAGGVVEGNNVIKLARKNFTPWHNHTPGNLSVWHPFNADLFMPEQSQGRVLAIGGNDFLGIIGYFGLNDHGRFVGVKRGMLPKIDWSSLYQLSSFDWSSI